MYRTIVFVLLIFLSGCTYYNRHTVRLAYPSGQVSSEKIFLRMKQVFDDSFTLKDESSSNKQGGSERVFSYHVRDETSGLLNTYHTYVYLDLVERDDEIYVESIIISDFRESPEGFLKFMEMVELRLEKEFQVDMEFNLLNED